MGFVKVVKNRAYFKRFQVKYRRRREGKTDYYARKRLVTQDKNKYNSPKYRFVVRITGADTVAQIIYATTEGDIVASAAYAHELTRFGLPVGHTNYAAVYATGLLLARRHLAKLGLAESYTGKTEELGEDYNVEQNGERRPFNALLDVGLARTSTGSRVFAALKGAVDGGIDVPHSPSRFVGYKTGEKEGSLDATILRKYIFAGHVADYMKKLSEEDPEKYKKQFSRYLKNGITADKLEEVIKKTHEAIRANPAAPEKKPFTGEKKRYHAKKLTYEQRRAAVAAKKVELGLTKY